MSCGCHAIPASDLASGCSCDYPRFPPVDPIAAGLPTLPRQRAGFGEYREHLLASVRRHADLADWRARAPGDLGLMLFDSFAYMLDVTAFYDAQIANESYVRTAKRRPSLRRLTGLTGYRPRPAVAASTWLAAFAAGHDPVTVPAGTGFRSKAFDGEPPQLFEVDADTIAHPARNAWKQAPVRASAFTGVFAFAPGAPGVAVGQTVLVFAEPGSASPSAAAVAEIRSQRLKDGADYRVARFAPAPAIGAVPLAGVRVAILAQSVTATPFTPASGNAVTATRIMLDSIYPQIRSGDWAAIEVAGGGLIPIQITTVEAAEIVLSGSGSNQVKSKVTAISFASVGTTPNVARVHVRAVEAGPLINPAEFEFEAEALLGTVALEAPVRIPVDMPLPDALIARGAGEGGARYTGTLAPGVDGTASVAPLSLDEAAADTLLGPVDWHGNLLKVTRGETVWNEVLGSGDSARAYQRFQLRKKPLTYLPSTSSAWGVAPQLEVSVNGIVWRRVDSFLAARPGERVYCLEQDDDGGTTVVFGDSARPETGRGNITASYRFGAGAAAPPPGAITQLAKRLPGLLKVVSPLRPSGGADAEPESTIRDTAPLKMMTTGRAVSLADYRAIAAGYAGVLNAAAAWAWDEAVQRAAVRLWIVSDGGSVAAALGAFIAGSSDGLTAISVAEASDIGATLAVEILHDPTFDRTAVEAAVRRRLVDPQDGLFSPRRTTIGGSFFRSSVSAAVMAVEGVLEVRAISINGMPAPVAVPVPEGCYLAFETVTIG